MMGTGLSKSNIFTGRNVTYMLKQMPPCNVMLAARMVQLCLQTLYFRKSQFISLSLLFFKCVLSKTTCRGFLTDFTKITYYLGIKWSHELEVKVEKMSRVILTFPLALWCTGRKMTLKMQDMIMLNVRNSVSLSVFSKFLTGKAPGQLPDERPQASRTQQKAMQETLLYMMILWPCQMVMSKCASASLRRGYQPDFTESVGSRR